MVPLEASRFAAEAVADVQVTTLAGQILLSVQQGVSQLYSMQPASTLDRGLWDLLTESSVLQWKQLRLERVLLFRS